MQLRFYIQNTYLALTHIFQEGLEFHRRIYAGFIVIFFTWLTVLFSILFSCFPLQKNWQIYPDPGSRQSNCWRIIRHTLLT